MKGVREKIIIASLKILLAVAKSPITPKTYF